MSAQPVTLISLTPNGRALAEKLAACCTEHLHKPQPFAQVVQEKFCAGHRLILICATGIAVRTLSGVLQNKHTDPAVLVLDERGQFVIPLVSGHEGGANAWGQQIADTLGAQCIITSAQLYTQPIYVAGIGCERHCAASAIAQLVERTLSEHQLANVTITMAASIELKQDEVGLLEWAAHLPHPPRFFSGAHLLRYTERLSCHSEIVFKTTGCYGVAEAAALAGAESLHGAQAELVIPKHRGQGATFALARTYHETTDAP